MTSKLGLGCIPSLTHQLFTRLTDEVIVKNKCIAVGLVYICLFLPAGFAWGEFFCPDSETALQNDLNTAASNSEDDTIQIVQGTYYGNFSYVSSKHKSITIKGGYLKVGSFCMPPPFPPSATKTILDGGGNELVLDVTNNSGGGVAVTRLTIRNGKGLTAKGGGVYAYSQAFDQPGIVEIANSIIEDNQGKGAVVKNHSTSGNSNVIFFTGNIVRNNTSTNAGGGAYVASSANSGKSGIIGVIGNTITNNEASRGGGIEVFSDGPTGTAQIFVDDNTILGNMAVTSGGGGIHIISETASSDFGTIDITNNIIAENSAAGPGGGVLTDFTSTSGTGNITVTHNTISNNSSEDTGGGIVLNNEKFFMVHNNILWGNSDSSGGGDIVIPLGKGFGKHNDYNELVGVWFEESNNINVSPYFIGNGDYHLQPSSPCRDKGSQSVPLPVKDIDGDNRVLFEGPDLGADEITQPYFPWSMFLPAIIDRPQP
jgi:hypothetical protein